MRKRSLPSFLQKFLVAASLVLAMLPLGYVSAQTPQYAYNTTGGSCNVFPLGNTATNMVQWIYYPTHFTPAPSTINQFITTIYIKPCNTNSAGVTYSNLQIKMGNTTLTNLTSGAWNAGLTTVYFNGSATIAGWTTGGWIQIPLQTNFLWTGGNFIIEISQTGYTGTGVNIDQNSALAGARMWGSVGSASSTSAGTGHMVFGFDALPAACSGTPPAAVIATAPFPAATPLCAGSTTNITATYPNLGTGIVYQWQSSTSSTGPFTNVTGGSGATTLSYTTGPITTNTYFRLAVTCTNSSSTSYSNPFLVPIGTPQPGVITGASTYCPGDPEVYAVPFVPGTTYAWTLPPGWTGFSTSNSITITPGPLAGPGTISVTATSPCGPTSIARTRAIVPGSAPGPPGTIQGNAHICGNTAQTYTVLPVGGASAYTWTLPSGWTGTSTTNTINTTASNTSGTITVRALNGCGQSSLNNLPVTVITALANPGTITGKDTVCSGDLQAYSIAPVPGATSYTWTLPSGWSGTTTGTSIQAFAGASTGTLSVTAYVSCAISPVSTKNIAVVTTVNPAVTISAPPSTLCQGKPITITASPLFPGSSPSYQWKKNGVNVIAFGNTYTTNTLAPGDSVSVIMTSNASCAANAVAASNTLIPNITPSVMPGVSINTVPPITLCKGTPVTFTTTSNGGGSTPAYQWFKNGSPIAGETNTTYTTAALSQGDTLTIQITTSAQCAIVPVATSNKVGVRVSDILTPSVSISVSPSDIVSEGQELTFTATQSNGGATPDYQWQKNGVNIPFATNSTYVSTELKPGDHIAVRMLSYAECVDQRLANSNTIVLKSALAVGGVAGQQGELSLYPNPTSGRFSIAAMGWAYSGKGVRVDVLSSVGQVVYHLELMPTVTNSSWQTQVILGEGLANGRYMLRVSTGDGSYKATLPFILNR
jgi:hypothetical protein